MAVHYTNAEITDMILFYGFCQGKRQKSECTKKYFRIGELQIIKHLSLRAAGSFVPATPDYEWNSTIRTAEVEEGVLERVEEDPSASTRHLCLEFGISKELVNRLLKDELLHPFNLQEAHEILRIDLKLKLEFCPFINEREHDPYFYRKFSFTGKCCFIRGSITNLCT